MWTTLRTRWKEVRDVNDVDDEDKTLSFRHMRRPEIW
jgi:hypothetical protein